MRLIKSFDVTVPNLTMYSYMILAFKRITNASTPLFGLTKAFIFLILFSRRKESTAADARLLARTCWPVSNAESLFLPHFPVDCNAVHRFHFVGHVANGAFGKVHRVRRASEDFALKVLSKSEVGVSCFSRYNLCYTIKLPF